MKKILLLFLLGGVAVHANPPKKQDGLFGNLFRDNSDLLDPDMSKYGVYKDRVETYRLSPEYQKATPDERQREETRLGELDKIAEAGKWRNGAAWHEGQNAVKYITALTRPRTVATIAIGACLAFAGWHALSLTKEVAKHYIMIPPLAQKTSIRSWTRTVKDFFIYEDTSVPDRSQVILDDLLAIRAEILTRSIIASAANDTPFRHYMFYGPPGTGKTMLAMAMAIEAGLEYIYISGADLDKYELEEGVKQIIHLFEYAQSYSKKLMIIIDEADALFGHRDTCSEKTRSFLSKILTYMGTEQSNFIVVTLSNRPFACDEAAKSRFGAKVEIGKPEFPERRRIFEQYIQKYLIDSHEKPRDNRSFSQWWFSRKPIDRMPLILAEDVLTDQTLDELARRSKGMVGRDISYALLAVQQGAYLSSDQTVTKAMLFASLDLKKQEDAAINAYNPEKPVLT